jgi:4-carboxymuconolactone decarboxylase
MRLPPLPREALSPELREVHDEIAELVARRQNEVAMLDAQGALTGPFPPLLHFPQFGIPALGFIRAAAHELHLAATVREVAILTVGAALGARFEVYAHELMAGAVGLSTRQISTLAAGTCPIDLSDEEAVAHDVARVLAKGRVVAASTYARAERLLGRQGFAELVFLVGSYALVATLLNAFDVPVPDDRG